MKHYHCKCFQLSIKIPFQYSLNSIFFSHYSFVFVALFLTIYFYFIIQYNHLLSLIVSQILLHYNLINKNNLIHEAKSSLSIVNFYINYNLIESSSTLGSLIYTFYFAISSSTFIYITPKIPS